MTNRTATKRRTPAKPAPPERGLPWLWIGLGAVVLLAAIVAVVVTQSSKDDDTTTVKAAGVQETQPVTVTGTALPALTDSGSDTAVGQTIPTVKGKSFDGSPVSIGPDGKAKVIVFVAHWCPHCQREVPLLVDHLKSNPVAAGVDLVTVATATTKDRPNYPPSSWLERVGWKAPVLADTANGDAATAFGLPGFPYFVAVNADGKVVDRTSGEIPVTQFDQLIQSAKNG